MFDLTWKKERIENRLHKLNFSSKLNPEEVESALLTRWEEHCVECAPPTCYTTCSKFIQRADGRCSRFKYGISDNFEFSGIYKYGADISFEDWAKLECRFNPHSVVGMSPSLLSKFTQVINSLSRFMCWISTLTSQKGQSSKIQDLTTSLLRRLVRIPSFYKRQLEDIDVFVFECFSFEEEEFYFNLNCKSSERILLLEKFTIKPGQNYFEISIERFNFASLNDQEPVWLSLTPQAGARPRVAITWLHFVDLCGKYRSTSAISQRSATKVKCVAWDLDNTIWNGVLIENSHADLTVRDYVRRTITEFDRRGIIQTIVSKNDHNEAWQMLEKMQLADFFVYPAINWGSKSENLKNIASKLNISIDSFAIIDDSSQERAEIEFALPMVRVYADTAIPTLSDQAEFDIPYDSMSSKRRKAYKDAEQRAIFEEKFSDNYFEYLRSLQIKIVISPPDLQDEQERCLELIQRSNQLNLTTNRYDASQFQKILDDTNVNSYAIKAQDRFGDYGIIAFISIDLTGIPLITNFVISCRIAQKRVEHAVVNRLAIELGTMGYQRLQARLYETTKNGPLVKIFDEMPFECTKKNGVISYELNDLTHLEDENVVHTVLKMTRV